MGVVADAALRRPGRMIDVLPRGWLRAEVAYHGPTELREADGHACRQGVGGRLPDGFTAYRVAFDTCDELFEALT